MFCRAALEIVDQRTIRLLFNDVPGVGGTKGEERALREDSGTREEEEEKEQEREEARISKVAGVPNTPTKQKQKWMNIFPTPRTPRLVSTFSGRKRSDTSPHEKRRGRKDRNDHQH